MQFFSRRSKHFAIMVCMLAWIVIAARAPAAFAQKKPAAKPDFGPNVLIFDPALPQADMQQEIDKIYAIERRNEFGPERYAILFLPGEYHLDVPVGFYTQILGLGATPDAVHIVGNVHADASHDNNNATTGLLACGRGIFRYANRRNDAMGGFSGRAVPTHARARRHDAPPASRVGQRRMDVRHARRRQRRFRQSAE